MKSIDELLNLSYDMGWTFVANKHIDLENGSCCPLAMYLLNNNLINRDASWLQVITMGNRIFDREELQGFLDGIVLGKMKLYNYNSAKKYSYGYLTGKKTREKWLQL